MPFSFLPRMIFPHLTDVTAEALRARGISFLMLDFDNTIVPYTTSEPTAQMAAWIRTMQASEIRLCIVSNSKKPRVVEFCKTYGLDCITHAKKPFSRGIRAGDAAAAAGADLCARPRGVRTRRRPDLYGRARRQLRRGAVHFNLGHS